MQKILYIPIDTTISNTVECEKLVKRGDTLILTIKVFINAVLADLTGQSIDLILKKSDNTLIEKTITSVSNGVITATLDVQATNVAGTVAGEIQIYTSDTLSSTNTFTFVVDTSLADDVLEASQDDIEVLADLKNTITDGNAAIDKYKTNVEAITGTAGAVEALANIKNYIDSNLDELESENAKAVVNIQNETGQNTQATQNIADLTALNSQATTLEGNLQTLTSENSQATSNISSLNTENTNATQNITDLTTKNSDAETNKTNLDSANTQAEANIQALEALGDVTEVAQDVTNLKNEVETARGTYNNLDVRLDADESNITSNSNKIGDLSANGLTETDLATAIKNDRTQLSEKANQTDLNTTNTNISNHLANLVTDTNGVHGLKIEYGTWTPAITGQAAAGSFNYSSQVGTYMKIGNLVIAWFDLSVSTVNTGGTGALQITGFPYVLKNDVSQGKGVSFSNISKLNLDTGYTQFLGIGQQAGNKLYIFETGNNISSVVIGTDRVIANTAIGGYITYRTA